MLCASVAVQLHTHLSNQCGPTYALRTVPGNGKALSAAGYEMHSRLPGLLDSDRLMLADVQSPEVYQRWAKTWTNPGACIAPCNVNGRGP
jgi:hypothetical protein